MGRGAELSQLGPGAQAQLRALGITVAAAHGRYQVSPVAERTVDGIVFASKWEASAYITFKREVGLPAMRLQVNFELQPKFVDQEGTKHRSISYRADFVLKLPDGEHVVDTKGHEDSTFQLKEKLFIFRYKRPLVKLRNSQELWFFLQVHGAS